MARRRRPGRSRRSLTIGLLVLASITIITLDYRGGGHGVISALKRVAHDTFSPVQSAVHDVVHPIGSFLAGAVHYGSLEQQNGKLQAEIARLQQEVDEGQATRQELGSLEQLEHLPWASGVPIVPAQVIALNPSDFAATIELNVGTSSGVEVGMPVSGGSGLVGRVVESYRSSCTVMLISDPQSRVSVRFGRNPSQVALANGEGPGRSISLQYVFPGVPLTKGELLTTSGLQGALFPPNLPVARITSFFSTPSSTQQTVSAQPVADLSGLQYVDVMQWEPPQ